jgi:hypothetical protein
MAYAEARSRHERDETPEQEKAEREDKLLRMLKSEEEESLGYAESEVTGQQIEALKRYYGEKYGDEEEGRSQVVTREVFETIEWQRNDYARIFGNGGNVVSLEETNDEDAKYAKAASDYLYWIFFSDNPGFENLDDFIFSGLLHRRGYLACYWRDKEYQAPQSLTGLNIMQVQELMQDQQVEIIGQDFDQESEVGGINLIVKRVKSPARAVIESIAPEDMRLNGRAVTIDGARYVGRVRRMLCGEAVRLWPEKKEDIIGACGNAGDGTGFTRRSDDVRAQRFKDDANDWRSQGNEEGQEVEILEEYLRIDLNDDGYPETIRSYRVGDVLLEEGEVEENPFASWTPIRVPHRFMGLSVHDITADLQRQSTVITRAGLDALYQAVVNREAYDITKLGEDGAAAMLSTVAGTKIPVNGDPDKAIKALAGSVDTTTIAWNALTIIKQRLEDRTGATRQTRGLDSDQLGKEHSGKALGMLQLNADARKEMTARNLATGLGDLFSKLYRLVCRNQNEARQARIAGKACTFDPRNWNSDLRCSVHSGGLNREHTLVGLQLIGQEQDKVIDALGPGNPMVTSRNRYRYQEELCRAVGWKTADPFFTDVPEEPEVDPQTGQPMIDEQTGQPKTKPWSPPPQPDPQMAKVEADAKAKQAEMQLKTEETKANLQLQSQKDGAELQASQQEAELKLTIMRETAQQAQQLAEAKAASEAQLAQQKAEAEMQLAWAKFEAEMKLAEAKQSAEIALAREQTAAQREMHSEKVGATREMHAEKVDADVKMSKNREGGSLSE